MVSEAPLGNEGAMNVGPWRLFLTIHELRFMFLRFESALMVHLARHVIRGHSDVTPAKGAAIPCLRAVALDHSQPAARRTKSISAKSFVWSS